MVSKEQITTVGDGLLVRAPAKINLSLLIAGKRPDGFHEIETVMAKVDFFDEILIEPGQKAGIELVCKGPYPAPQGNENLVYQACAFFSVLGGTIAFSLGLAIGPERLEHFLGFVAQFLEWISFGLIDLEDKVQKSLEIYQKYNVWAIAVSALTPVPYMIFSWVGGAMANVSVLKFVGISVIFRTMRFGGEALLFYFLGERARRLIEKYFNLATIAVIILLAVVVYVIRWLGHIFTG
ncbi:putative 4-diphosphocytidyl-2-C-methyl-D-erythritol kinase [subsurface metagenome]